MGGRKSGGKSDNTGLLPVEVIFRGSELRQSESRQPTSRTDSHSARVRELESLS